MNEVTVTAFADMDFSTSPNASMYPDPEDMPTYPWLGASTLLSPNQTPQVSTSLALCFNGSSVDGEDDGERDAIDEPQLPAGKDPNDPLVDPDFQFSEASASDDFLSEAGSESPSAGPGINHRRRARPGEGLLRNGRSAGKRGRPGKKLSAGRGGKGIKRGPRKPLEPNIEFKALHSQATMAFIANDYEEAEQLALKAINFNPEMFAAHSLLSEIHMARGDRDKAVIALFNGAHTRPGDAQVWLRVAQLLLDREADEKHLALPDAIYCLSRAINLEQDNVDARYQRASLNRDLGYNGRAANEYEQLLKYIPHNTAVLRQLAEIYIDLGEVDRALQNFDNSIAYHQSNEPTEVTSFSWSDVNIYAELHGYQDQYGTAISKLKALSRWLLGRGDEDFWETYEEDDREWDAEDCPRRIAVDCFTPGAFQAHTYGDGLPLELRIKLGVYRLRLGDHTEALDHFEWLDPEDYGPGATLFDYADLFREAADALRVAGLYHDALRFYEPLQEVTDFVDALYLRDMAFCYQELGLRAEAEACYETIAEDGGLSVDIRSQLAAMCKEHGASECSTKLLKKLSLAANERFRSSGDTTAARENAQFVDSSSGSATMLASRPRTSFRPHAFERRKRLREREQRERDQETRMYGHFLHLQGSMEKSRLGEEAARSEWMSAARSLVQDFRSNSIFYPPDRYMRFLGYTSEARARSAATKPNQAGTEMHSDQNDPEVSMPIPDEYRGICFSAWLDIFLEFALVLAQDGNLAYSYDVIAGARDANVFYHSPESLLLIHVCWFTCALLRNDEVTLSKVSRWFIKEYQLITDGYRLFSALNRLCDTDNSWFNCSPSQKFILRQIKAVDFSLIGDSYRKSIFQERAGYSRDNTRKLTQATDVDIVLLMLYGQILYAGKSFTFALNYFFRAYALDPDNALINLSIALSYIHHGLKRQADNRHHLVMQGIAYLSKYYDICRSSGDTVRSQEAEYNTARAYHLLGLTPLAVAHYQLCLTVGKAAKDNYLQGCTDDFSREAAFALQGLWAIGGCHEEARRVTREWLTI